MLGLMRAVSAAALAMTVAAGFAGAQPYEAKPLVELLPAGVSYDRSVPTPESVTGYRTGEIVLPFELLTQYVRAVDAASDRVSVEVIGYTHLRRPILAVTITSPENQARLAEIQAAQQRVLETGERAPDDQPVIVEIAHGVHGAEISGYDMIPLLLYHLAAATDAETRATLDDTVVTLITTMNPDGGSRMASWVNSHHAATPVAYPGHRERGPFFLWGRTNHYWFDLNRQWLPVTQPEAVAAVNLTQDWLPHVVADMHEMGEDATYFFSPGPHEGLHPLLTEEAFELTRTIGETIVADADAAGRLYVTEENFDDYYLGYGSSYPALLGAVPFLFEQSSTRGLVYDGVDGLQRYDDKIAEHFSSAYAMIRGAAGAREALLDYQARYFAGQSDAAAALATKAYVFTSSDGPRLARFLELLANHRIETHALARAIEVDGVSYAPGEAFVVAVDQPRHSIIEGLFEIRIPEGKSEFYDVSGWTMPLAFGLDYAPLDRRLYRADLLGAPASADSVAAPAAPAATEYAYVMEWGTRTSPRVLYRLLSQGLMAKVMPAPARVRTAEGLVDVARGAVVIPVAGQNVTVGQLHGLMVTAAETDGVVIHAAVSGLTPSGPDLGGFALTSLHAPRVLLVTGLGVSGQDAGEIWRLLDLEMGMPVAMIDQNLLTASALGDFTHVILVNGSYDGFSDDLAQAMGTWVERGGVLVATRGGAEWAITNELTSARSTSSAEPDDDAAPVTRVPFGDKQGWDAEETLTGAVFVGGLDPTHPIAFGYERDVLHSHRIGVHAFEPSADNPFAAVAWYGDEPLVSGYASARNLERLAGKTSIFAERRGDGAVVLFADDPAFRAYWLGTEKLLLNALFFSGAITAPNPRPVQ